MFAPFQTENKPCIDAPGVSLRIDPNEELGTLQAGNIANNAMRIEKQMQFVGDHGCHLAKKKSNNLAPTGHILGSPT